MTVRLRGELCALDCGRPVWKDGLCALCWRINPAERSVSDANCGGRDYRHGCTCGDCHRRYISEHASACSYGTDPRLDAA